MSAKKAASTERGGEAEEYQLNKKNTFFCDKYGNMIRFQKDADGNSPILPKGVTNKQRSPGMELYESLEKAVNVIEHKRIINRFKKTEQSWFKFVLFKIKKTPKLYLILGNPKINKHSVCLLYGILEDNPEHSPEYNDIRELMHAILRQKRSSKALTEDSPLIIEFNEKLYEKLGCMDAIIAGSGIYMNDELSPSPSSGRRRKLCLNNKSGHYKPSVEEILRSTDMPEFQYFFQPSKWDLRIMHSPTEKQLKIVYGEDELLDESGEGTHKRYENYLGTCLNNEEMELIAANESSIKKPKKASAAASAKEDEGKRQQSRTTSRKTRKKSSEDK